VQSWVRNRQEGGETVNDAPIRSVVGRRIDWLSVAFRVRIPKHRIELLADRCKTARKHGRAPCELGGDFWSVLPPKGPSWWLECEARSERLELLLTAPGGYVDGLGEVIPGFTVCLHVSGVKLAIGRTSTAVRRGWRLAKRIGEVFEGRVRRVDVTADFRGVLVDAIDEGGWHATASRVGVTRELEDGTQLERDRSHVERNRDRADRCRRSGRDRSPVGGGRSAREALHRHPAPDVQLSLLPGGADDGLDVRPRRGP